LYKEKEVDRGEREREAVSVVGLEALVLAVVEVKLNDYDFPQVEKNYCFLREKAVVRRW